MIEATASIDVTATPRTVLEFVLDLKKYCQVDRKIISVYANPPVDDFGNGMVEFRGALRGLPGPRQRQRVELNRWTSVTFTSDGPWFADAFMGMVGGFLIHPSDSGSAVTHTYNIRFRQPLCWLMEFSTKNWLQQDVEHELELLAAYFEPTHMKLP